ncbi:hypothetical protein EGW08_003372 [Elysia chlorotica]|uniref:Cyclic nucleotide-binding domain-containing protein n=1 Tax=Elysia chlorotica TaxID=188477 RepID=A0A433U4R6_ELYCH|nr:hypothetical protein EGW08_003372 [Elysia chlorotica]
MKWLKSAPPKLQIPSTRKILASIPWIDKNQRVVDYIKTFGKRIFFQYNDRIVNVDDPFNGIHVIISGLVRMSVAMRDQRFEPKFTHFLGRVLKKNLVGVNWNTPMSVAMQGRRFEPKETKDLVLVVTLTVVSQMSVAMRGRRSLPKELLLSRLADMRVRHVTSRTLDITRDMNDIVLITGEALDCNSMEAYKAPCFIPQRVTCLEFPSVNLAGGVNPTISYTLSDKPGRVHAMMRDSFKSERSEKFNVQI